MAHRGLALSTSITVVCKFLYTAFPDPQKIWKYLFGDSNKHYQIPFDLLFLIPLPYGNLFP